MVSRPDNLKLATCAALRETPMCIVVSARLVQLNGRRAIFEKIPYDVLKHLFQSDDGDSIFCEAEFKDGHLEFYGRSGASIEDWVLYSYTPELLLRASHEMAGKTN